MSKRTEKYAKNKLEENILSVVNESLKNKEIELIQPFTTPKLPIIFIVGAQRSGTTLLMQLLTQFFHLSYPSNFIARFWEAPYIGAMLYKNISKNNDDRQLNFQSDLGYTKGLQGSHEFGYFWKKWFPWESWEEKQYDKIDYNILKKELAAWESVNNTSLIFKNIINVSFNIEWLSSLFPNAFFIHIKRKPEFVAQSTYLSRIKLFNNPKTWMGLKPPKYNEIKNLPVIEQICAQVYYSVKYIEESLTNENINSITLNYEDLVTNTNDILQKLNKVLKLKSSGMEVLKLNNTDGIKLPGKEFNNIKIICKKYFN